MSTIIALPRTFKMFLLVVALAHFGFTQPSNLSTTEWEITGTINENGRPVNGIGVRLTGPDPLLRDAKTDSSGRYTIKGRLPGLYSIGLTNLEKRAAPAARFVRIAPGQRLDLVDFALPSPGSISGKVFSSDRKPVSGILVQAIAETTYSSKKHFVSKYTAVTNRDGEYRIDSMTAGKYLVLATSKTRIEELVGSNEKKHESTQRVPRSTFYPSAISPADSFPVEVRSGRESYGIEIAMRLEPVFCASFDIPAALHFRAEQFLRVTPHWGAPGLTLFEAKVSQPGRYSICNVPSGDYELHFSQTAKKPFQELGYLRTVFHIVDRNVDLLILPVPSPVVLRGRVRLEGNSPSSGLPGDMRVRILPNDRDFLASDLSAPKILPDGTFSGKSVYIDDSYSIEILGLPEKHYLSGASQHGQSIDLKAYQPSSTDLVLTISNRGSVLRGRTVDSHNKAVPNAHVFLTMKSNSTILTTHSDQDGIFTFSQGLLPGDYRIACVVGPVSHESHGFFDLSTTGWKLSSVSLERGASKIMDVPVTFIE